MALLFFLLLLALGCCGQDVQFVDGETIGLKNDLGDVCLSISFRVEILNLEANNTIGVPFDLTAGDIKGRCAKSRKHEAHISSSVNVSSSRTKQLSFYFKTEEMRVKHVDELRWQLKKVVYSETFRGNTAFFESDNTSVVFSAPITQKYVCQDRINVTLTSDEFSFNIIAMFYPEIDVQPYGPKSNFFICERSRKKTLSQSLDSASTVASGVVLGISSVLTIVGHMVRRHFIPQRKQIYENLTGNNR